MQQVETVNDVLRSENSRLQWLVAELAARNEMLSLQLRQQERHSEKRRREVASLHQACAKYKRARFECAQRRRRPSETKSNSPTPPQPSPPLPMPPNNDVPVVETSVEVSFETHSVKEAFDICFRECGRRKTRHQQTSIATAASEPGNTTLEESARDFHIGRERFFRLVDEERMRCEAAAALERVRRGAHLGRSLDQRMLMFRRRNNGSAAAG